MPGVTGEPALHAEPLAKATEALSLALQSAGLQPPAHAAVREAIARRVVRAYVKGWRGLESTPRLLQRVLPETRMLAEMAIGDRKEFPPAARQVYHSRMKTARALLSNDGARWRVETEGLQVFITRQPDHERPAHDPRGNARAMWLAGLNITQIGNPPPGLFKNIQSVTPSTKAAARKLLGVEDAQWRGRTTNRGLSIQRIK